MGSYNRARENGSDIKKLELFLELRVVVEPDRENKNFTLTKVAKVISPLTGPVS
jgi:hypothetical protein